MLHRWCRCLFTHWRSIPATPRWRCSIFCYSKACTPRQRWYRFYSRSVLLLHALFSCPCFYQDNKQWILKQCLRMCTPATTTKKTIGIATSTSTISSTWKLIQKIEANSHFHPPHKPAYFSLFLSFFLLLHSRRKRKQINSQTTTFLVYVFLCSLSYTAALPD